MKSRSSIQTCANPASAAAWCEHTRQEGGHVGFVPTMGGLHEGHLDLVRRAVEAGEECVVSIFVNPLQFDDPADLERYPRDFEADRALLARAGAAMVFQGTLGQFFPEVDNAQLHPERVPRVDPGPAADGLEGARREGHFAGVATIVQRLFELVRPRSAYFGAKDFQQTLIVKHVARRLGYPRIVVSPTVRADDGLALSSRNVRLSAAAREEALWLHRSLLAAAEAWQSGERDAARLRQVLAETLARPGIQLEYAEVRDPDAWSASRGRLEGARALIAARVGDVRLIDNLRLDEAE